jgi:hypothetical protein
MLSLSATSSVAIGPMARSVEYFCLKEKALTSVAVIAFLKKNNKMYEFEVEQVLGGHPLPKTLKIYCEFNPEPGCAPATGFDVAAFKRRFFKFEPEYKSKWLIFLEWNPQSRAYGSIWRPDAIKAQSEQLSAEVKRLLAERKYPFENPNSKPSKIPLATPLVILKKRTTQNEQSFFNSIRPFALSVFRLEVRLLIFSHVWLIARCSDNNARLISGGRRWYLGRCYVGLVVHHRIFTISDLSIDLFNNGVNFSFVESFFFEQYLDDSVHMRTVFDKNLFHSSVLSRNHV